MCFHLVNDDPSYITNNKMNPCLVRCNNAYMLANSSIAVSTSLPIASSHAKDIIYRALS